MPLFSEKLEEYHSHSGMSYTEMAKRAGIDRTELLRMKKGERTGDVRALERLCEALMLSASQEEELRRYYLIARMGDDVYARRKLVKSLIEHIGHLSDDLPLNVAMGAGNPANFPEN